MRAALALLLLLLVPAPVLAHGGEHHELGAAVVAPACPGPNSGDCCCDKLVGTQPPAVRAVKWPIAFAVSIEVPPGEAVQRARIPLYRNLSRAPPPFS